MDLTIIIKIILEAILKSIVQSSPLVLLILAILFLIIYYNFRKYRWLFDIFRDGGIEAYHSKFSEAENRNIWSNAEESIKYLGISAQSILPSFKTWLAQNPHHSNIKFYFLLMDPDGQNLPNQLAHERNLNDLSRINQSDIDLIKRRIQNGIDELKNLDIYKNGKLEIRVYDEFIPWWMYIIDNRKLYLGLLPRGVPGIDAPLIKMRKIPNHVTLFDSFDSIWDRLWNSAKKV